MFCIHNFSKQSGTKRCFTNTILTAGKGEKDLYLSNSIPVWNKKQPAKHPEELFIAALTRGNACFIPRESSQTPNLQSSSFGSPLQAFVCIPIWKISGLSCVPTKLISCMNRPRLGMCYSEFFMIRLCAKMYPSSEIQPTRPTAPKQANSVMYFKCILKDLGISGLVRVIHGRKHSGFPVWSSSPS